MFQALGLGSVKEWVDFIRKIQSESDAKQMLREILYQEHKSNLSLLYEVRALSARKKDALADSEKVKLIKYLKFDAYDAVTNAGVSLKVLMDWLPEIADDIEHRSKIIKYKTMPELYFASCQRFRMQKVFAEEGIIKNLGSIGYAIAIGKVVKDNLEYHI